MYVRKKCFLCTVNQMKPILTITGSDSTGGSGVQADIKTISALGGYAVSVITSITVQNTLGIQEFFDLPADIVSGQLEAIINDVQPDIVKVGMIRNTAVLGVVIDALTKYRPQQIIYDPVVHSSRGDALMTEDVMAQIRQRLLPLCSLVIIRKGDVKGFFGKNTGDYPLYILDETTMHGMANSFSSAVAVYLNKGEAVEAAIAQAKEYIGTQIVRSSDLKGRSSELYNEFLDAVGVHIKRNSDVAFYADYLNVSSRYLAQVTRRICGKAPKVIIDEWLVREIETQLRSTQKTVQEIAYDFGFSSQAHFAKFFKKQVGVTPSEYRRK